VEVILFKLMVYNSYHLTIWGQILLRDHSVLHYPINENLKLKIGNDAFSNPKNVVELLNTLEGITSHKTKWIRVFFLHQMYGLCSLVA